MKTGDKLFENSDFGRLGGVALTVPVAIVIKAMGRTAKIFFVATGTKLEAILVDNWNKSKVKLVKKWLKVFGLK